MRRREVLKLLTGVILSAGFAPNAWARVAEPFAVRPGDFHERMKDYLEKMRHFDEPHRDDVVLEPAQHSLLESCVKRLERLEEMAGQGNFEIIPWDEGLQIARDYRVVGEFPKAELDFLEEIFYADAARYGFLGKKSLTRITERIPENEVVKVPRSGNYLYKGKPLETYERMVRDVGDQIILTSGVRGVLKQSLLFLRKAYDNADNLSLASRSLAPPGYSFHGISDFDVGQVGFGLDNFTSRFATTPVYKKLKTLSYIGLRYPQGNMVGVRFEPWHIKVRV